MPPSPINGVDAPANGQKVLLCHTGPCHPTSNTALQYEIIRELRSVTSACHMGSRRVTCHPTQLFQVSVLVFFRFRIGRVKTLQNCIRVHVGYGSVGDWKIIGNCAVSTMMS